MKKKRYTSFQYGLRLWPPHSARIKKLAKTAEDSAVFVHLGDSSVLCQISPVTKCVHVYTNQIKAKELIKQQCPNLCWWRRINILTCHEGHWHRTMALHSQHQMAQSIPADHCQASNDIYYTSLSYPFRKTSSSRMACVWHICVLNRSSHSQWINTHTDISTRSNIPFLFVKRSPEAELCISDHKIISCAWSVSLALRILNCLYVGPSEWNECNFMQFNLNHKQFNLIFGKIMLVLLYTWIIILFSRLGFVLRVFAAYFPPSPTCQLKATRRLWREVFHGRLAIWSLISLCWNALLIIIKKETYKDHQEIQLHYNLYSWFAI